MLCFNYSAIFSNSSFINYFFTHLPLDVYCQDAILNGETFFALNLRAASDHLFFFVFVDDISYNCENFIVNNQSLRFPTLEKIQVSFWLPETFHTQINRGFSVFKKPMLSDNKKQTERCLNCIHGLIFFVTKLINITH